MQSAELRMKIARNFLMTFVSVAYRRLTTSKYRTLPNVKR